MRCSCRFLPGAASPRAAFAPGCPRAFTYAGRGEKERRGTERVVPGASVPGVPSVVILDMLDQVDRKAGRSGKNTRFGRAGIRDRRDFEAAGRQEFTGFVEVGHIHADGTQVPFHRRGGGGSRCGKRPGQRRGECGIPMYPG